MPKRRIAYWLAGVALLTCYGCPGVNWSEGYSYQRKQPFDLYALHELLAARPEGLSLVKDTLSPLLADSTAAGNYVYVGHAPYYRETSVTALLAFVERGNTAFIATPELPEDLAYHLFGDDCYYATFEDRGMEDRFPVVQRDSIVTYLRQPSDSFPLVNTRYWRPYPTRLGTVSEELLCDPLLDHEVLGGIDTVGINYLRLGWGEGNFYFHTNPLYLTNYYLVDSLAPAYAEAVLSVLGAGPVYWDEYHRNYRRPPPRGAGSTAARRRYNGGRNLLSGNEALSYIQEQPELAMAWYTLIAGVLLFVLFRGRRRQRIIPVISPRENSSRQFIDTISRLVYQKGNHHSLAQRELASLRHHLLRRFGIRWREGEPPPEHLAARSGLDPATVTRAATEIRAVEDRKFLGENELQRFYRAIEPFYRV